MSAITSWSQDWKRTQNWYFGDSAGLSFATDPPTVLTDGQMYALEGCATISDTAGNLLFYTNGLTVWNKNHEVMENGTGLQGYESSAQPAIIVPQPGNDSIYYIFTTGGDAIFTFELRYSIVNIINGLGKVVSKNILLMINPTEKLAATHHANGCDVWVATHARDNNYLYSFLVTERGVVHCPVISRVGSVMTGGANQTQMQFSYSGKLACVSYYSDKFCELLRFNDRTGKFSNPAKIRTKGAFPVGICFSPKEDRLYIAEKWTSFVQYDISLLDELAINNSRKVFYSHFSIGNDFRAIEEKIHYGLPGNDYLGYFIPSQYPDSLPNLYDSAINISPGKTTYGSPNFISSYFYQPSLDITYHSYCQGDSVVFKARASSSLVSPFWQVYRQGNLLHAASSQDLSYFFPDTGTYFVQLIEQSDTIGKEVFIEPHLELGSDTLICNISQLNLTLPDNIRCIQWQDGSDTNEYEVTESGTYYVSGYNNRGCLLSDTIRIKMGNILAPIISRSGDSLYTDTGSYIYKWYHNGTATGGNYPNIHVKQTGNYQVEITDSLGCTATSSPFSVTVLSFKLAENTQVRLFPNPIREGQLITIDADEELENIVIYDVHGKIVYQKSEIGSYTTEIHMPQRGIFFIHINQTIKAKIIIH